VEVRSKMRKAGSSGGEEPARHAELGF